ncbi:MAG: preprotein translocase subunit SecG [Clostridia bacterium]|nr:preprotein translocase subunit SecG [Clostridia bacterium]
MSETLFTLYMVLTVACLILIFLAALVTIILVLFQKSNSDGIQGITASSETFFGKNRGRSIESQLKKWTWICLVVIGVLAIVIYVVGLLAG